jgi:hypothetical protein
MGSFVYYGKYCVHVSLRAPVAKFIAEPWDRWGRVVEGVVNGLLLIIVVLLLVICCEDASVK